jgi:apolipoprotein N-acyltransferase
MADAPWPDGLETPPSYWQVHARWLAPLAVFVSTALLTVLAFPPYAAPEFAYAFASPAIFWAFSRPPLKVFCWTIFAAQAVAWIVLLCWLRHVTFFGLLLLGPFVGAWVGCWYLAVWWTMPRLHGRSAPVRMLAQLGLAGAWVLVEWTRTWFITGFPWLPLAASQWQRTSILQIAAYTGAYGVSFVLIAMNVGFAAYAHRLLVEGERNFLKRRSPEFLLALFLLLACLSIQVQETINRRLYHESLGRIARHPAECQVGSGGGAGDRENSRAAHPGGQRQPARPHPVARIGRAGCRPGRSGDAVMGRLAGPADRRSAPHRGERLRDRRRRDLLV